MVSGVRVSNETVPLALDAPRGGFTFMMQPGSWGSWVFTIDGIEHNATSGVNSVRFGAGGFQEARGTGGPTKGGGGFYCSHRRELLDSVGEFYHDNVSNVLYLAVASPASSDSSLPGLLFVPQVAQLFRVEGSQVDPVVAVRVGGVTIAHARPTYMSPYTVPSGGDYSVHRGGAIHLNGTANSTVDACLFDRVGGNAIWLTDFNRFARIAGNHIRFPGENGVGLTGSTVWVDGTGGNQPRRNTIEGNLIHHVGLYTKQACAVFYATSAENVVQGNILFHGPRA